MDFTDALIKLLNTIENYQPCKEELINTVYYYRDMSCSDDDIKNYISEILLSFSSIHKTPKEVFLLNISISSDLEIDDMDGKTKVMITLNKKIQEELKERNIYESDQKWEESKRYICLIISDIMHHNESKNLSNNVFLGFHALYCS